MSCLVCGTGLVDCSAGLSPFIKDRSSKHRNILGCWYFLAIIEFSKLWLKKGVNIVLTDDRLKHKTTMGQNSGNPEFPARNHPLPEWRRRTNRECKVWV